MTSPIARPAHLQRPGDHKVDRADYTGRRQIAVQEEADEKLAAREKQAALLLDPESSYMYIKVRDHLVPVDREAYAEIKRSLGR